MTIQRQVMATYLSLRVAVAVIGFVLPLLLWAGGNINGVSLQGSMSAYYHAARDCNAKPPCVLEGAGPMRNWLVGILFVVGIIMYLYKGFSFWEDFTLNIAGVMAVCVALFPMSWMPEHLIRGRIHDTCAVLFFFCIAAVCEFCSGETLSRMPHNLANREKIISSYKRRYRILAVLMIVSPIAAIVINRVIGQHIVLFLIETFGVWAFSAYWLVKTLELKLSEVEKRALQGEFDMAAGA